MELKHDDIIEAFAANGSLARNIPGYRARAAQEQMALAVADTIADSAVLFAEAGTGTGKTWAYMLPLMLAGCKALVSTGTRNLQDQLYQRDIPRLREALALSIDVALLKGRSNYVCHYHLERYEQDLIFRADKHQAALLRKIRRFVSTSTSGDIAEFAEIPENHEIWSKVTSTRENCLGQECPFAGDCFLYKARRHAHAADVIVINHALFMTDLMLRQDGSVELLPQVQAVVFDEAHQLPELATRYLGKSLSLAQVADFCRDQLTKVREHAPDNGLDWLAHGAVLEKIGQDLRQELAEPDIAPGQKLMFDQLSAAQLARAQALAASLSELCTKLDAHAERHPDIAAAWALADSLRDCLMFWLEPAKDSAGAPPWVRWVEVSLHGFRIHCAPLEVAQIFAAFKAEQQAWIMTSATLAIAGDFGHFQEQLGLPEARCLSWPSPFDYAARALLYVPQHLPWPNEPGFLPAFVAELLPLVRQSPGGVLVLCTTLKAVDYIADCLERDPQTSARKLLRQGQESRNLILERFRSDGSAILVGSISFWEGIDVPGESLTLVAVDKLPFAHPDDPVLEARIKASRARGEDAFMRHQLPRAALLLKQGAGRLMRSETDWGVLMVGDARLVEKPYGRLLWRDLPPFTRNRARAVALEFLFKPGEPSSDSELGPGTPEPPLP